MDTSRAWFWLCCSLFFACGESERSGFDASALQRNLDERNEQAALACECGEAAQASASEKTACLTEHGAVRPAERECLLGVHARYGAAISDFARCVQPAAEVLTACLEEHACEEDAAKDCEAAYEDERKQCLEQFPLPKGLKTEEAFCFEASTEDANAGMQAKPAAAEPAMADDKPADMSKPASMPAAAPMMMSQNQMAQAGSTAGTAAPPPAGACTHELVGATKLTVPSEWVDTPSECDYLVRGTVSLTSSLTIQPGTVVQFSQDASFFIESGGALTAVGTPAKRIRFIGVNDVSGYWNSVQFLAGSREARVEYVDIRNAGQTGRLKYGCAIGGNGALSFKHNRISRSYLHGANFGETLVLKGFEDNEFFDNMGFGVIVGYNQVAKLDVDSDYNGQRELMPNGRPYIYADWANSQSLTTPSVWKHLPAPYYFDIVLGIDAPLTLEPGVTLVASDTSAIDINTRGSLTAIGTELLPIVFTAENPRKGAWAGLQFYQSSSEDNVLQHVVIEYAGSGGSIRESTAIQLISSNTPSALAISDSTIRETAGPPICYSNDLEAPILSIENVEYMNNNGSAPVVCN